MKNIDIILFLVFLIFKLTGIINWSWWIICLPIYFIPAIFAIVAFFVAGIAILGKIFE
jgi:hypothetical protein